MAPPNNDVGAVHVTFVVSDCRKAYEELKAKGVQFNREPQVIPGGPWNRWVIAYLRDPDGVTLELVQPASQLDS